MKIYKTFSNEAAKILKDGGVGVIPTDTLYGIVASALDAAAVERVYTLRHRAPSKPFIILISSALDLKKFGIAPGAYAKEFFAKYWPGKVSVVLPIAHRRSLIAKKISYLHRGTNSLAFRVPAEAKLRRFLSLTGPLVAPSANPEGESPAKTISEAKKYFSPRVSSPRRRGSKKNNMDSRSRSGMTERAGVDFYIDAGKKDSQPSTLVKILKNKVMVLREGAVKIGG